MTTNTNSAQERTASIDLDSETLWEIHGVVKNTGETRLAHKISDAIARRAQQPAAHDAGQEEASTQTVPSIGDDLHFSDLITELHAAHEEIDPEHSKKTWATLVAYIDGRTADQQPGAWKVLADSDRPNPLRSLDVVLTNGTTLESQNYSQIDWTQVADWRYAATKEKP